MRLILFLDALDYNDLGEEWKDITKQYTPNVPRVTPWIISQIMSGCKDPKFIRSTPYRKPRITDLKGDTILHYATKKGLKVLQYGIPLCSNIRLRKGSLTTYDHFLKQQQVPAILQFANANVNFQKDDINSIFNGYVDEVSTLFSTFRNIMRNNRFDIVFLGFQRLDALTHWYHERERRDLIKVLYAELVQTHKDLKCDIMFFSDHGSARKTKMFRINRWLKEKGWLDYEVNYKLLKQNKPRKFRFPDQVSLDSPLVYVNWKKTKFFCNDAFDIMIDCTKLANGIDRNLLKEQLMDTGYFDNIEIAHNLVMPETKEGICASCNVHKNAERGKNIGNMRTGWHSKRAVYGSTSPLKTVVREPINLYRYMCEFIDLEEPKKEKELPTKTVMTIPKDAIEGMTGKLENLGYI